MKTHYRRLTRDEVADLQAALSVTVDGETHTPLLYRTLASFGAVKVGESERVILPRETPFRDALRGAGYRTVGDARKGPLTDVEGVGDATATKIRDALPRRAIYVYVPGEDSEDLPGEYVGRDLDDLKPEHRRAVARAAVVRTDAEGTEGRVRVPEGDVDDNEEPEEVGLKPMVFAGE